MFHFKLQQVLDYREQLRDQAQITHAQILADYHDTEKHVIDLQQALDENEYNLHNLPPAAYNDRWLIAQCIKGFREDLSLAKQRLHELTQSLDHAKIYLARRAKEHKILEKLKEKQCENYVKKEKADEQRNFDESSSMRYKPPSY